MKRELEKRVNGLIRGGELNKAVDVLTAGYLDGEVSILGS